MNNIENSLSAHKKTKALKNATDDSRDDVPCPQLLRDGGGRVMSGSAKPALGVQLPSSQSTPRKTIDQIKAIQKVKSMIDRPSYIGLLPAFFDVILALAFLCELALWHVYFACRNLMQTSG